MAHRGKSTWWNHKAKSLVPNATYTYQALSLQLSCLGPPETLTDCAPSPESWDSPCEYHCSACMNKVARSVTHQHVCKQQVCRTLREHHRQVCVCAPVITTATVKEMGEKVCNLLGRAIALGQLQGAAVGGMGGKDRGARKGSQHELRESTSWKEVRVWPWKAEPLSS